MDSLQVAELSVQRNGRTLLHNLSFEARAGSVTALIGPNGAGKSTALKAIMGLLPAQGRLRFGGKELSSIPFRMRAQALAYVPQHSALEAPLPVFDVVAQGRFAHGEGPFATLKKNDRIAIAQALARTDCEHLADRPFDRLSYGERRRVLLARALATEAAVLLLDEPTAALDVGHALATLELLRILARAGKAVLVVLHPLPEILEFADHAVLLDHGLTVASGTPLEVLSPENTARVYGVELITAVGVRRIPTGKGPTP